MSACYKCGEQVILKDSLSCTDCKQVYHPTCTKLSSLDKFKKTSSAAKSTWKCDQCKTESSSRSDADDPSDDRVLRAIERMRREMSNKISEVNVSVEGVKGELVGVNSSIDDIKRGLEELRKENAERKEENKRLMEENKHMKLEVEDLRSQLKDVQQYTRRNNLEIVGVPYTSGENVSAIMTKLAAVIKVDFQAGDISIAHRLRTSKRNQHPPIIAQFVSRTVKNSWIVAARANREKLTAAELSDNFPSTWIHLNDHLTVDNKMVLGRAKAMVKERKLRYAWTRDCRVMVRQTEDSPAVHVRSLQEIDQVLHGGDMPTNR